MSLGTPSNREYRQRVKRTSLALLVVVTVCSGSASEDLPTVRCWGDGYQGRLGDGTSSIVTTPTLVP